MQMSCIVGNLWSESVFCCFQTSSMSCCRERTVSSTSGRWGSGGWTSVSSTWCLNAAPNRYRKHTNTHLHLFYWHLCSWSRGGRSTPIFTSFDKYLLCRIMYKVYYSIIVIEAFQRVHAAAGGRAVLNSPRDQYYFTLTFNNTWYILLK